MIAEIERRAERAGGAVAPNHLADPDRRIEQTIAYMLEHLHQPMQVANLAARANMSLSHYFALFKRRTGSAPIDFFIRLRMHHACRLLENTSLNVKQVAAALGYDDPFYFSRVFKSVHRVAPSEYRFGASGSRRHGSCILTTQRPVIEACSSPPFLPAHRKTNQLI